MNQMLTRVKDAIFEHALKLKNDENLLVVSHGDPIRSFIADCLGIHLDNFQRITIDPCSVSVVIISNDNVQVISVNNSVKVDQISKKKNKRIGSVLGGGAG
jgi:broad specificity phosphatase PhoE